MLQNRAYSYYWLVVPRVPHQVQGDGVPSDAVVLFVHSIVHSTITVKTEAYN